jgi:hypothetical protein
MKITEIIVEGVAGPKSCWPGHRKVGTKPGTGKNAGKRVNDCEKIGEQGVAEANLSELNKDTVYSYAKKAHKDQDKQSTITGKAYLDNDPKTANKAHHKFSMRAAGLDRAEKRLNKEGMAEDLDELHQEFDMIESIIEQIADQHAIDVDLVWEDLSVLSDDELYVFAVTSELINEDWQKANKRDKTDGMSQKAVNAYRRENPGSKLKTAVTTKPSKLKKGGKASKRRKSYCSRSRGQMKMHSISCSKTPDKAICKARRRWNC